MVRLDELRNFRFFLGAVVLIAACGYDAPTVGENSSTSSSSSSGMSSGMGGTSGETSSSSSGQGGSGGLSVSSAISSAVSGSSSSSSGVGPGGGGGFGGGGVGGSGMQSSDPVVQDCGGDCNTMPDKSICCWSTIGGTGMCNTTTGACPNPADFALKCDDKADCAVDTLCCLDGPPGFERATCTPTCTKGYVLCKDDGDCPVSLHCSQIHGKRKVCGP